MTALKRGNPSDTIKPLTTIPDHHSTSLHHLSITRRADIRKALLSWFSKNARPMPWRLPPVPYTAAPYSDYIQRFYVCLISETMLQQTQVATVIAYYTKWLLLFPTIQDLAEASEEQVMAAWAGLGYYSRAKRLHQAAQFLVNEFVSKALEFPYEPEFWIKKVPGVGPYTAGAIISQSFDISSAIVDGNVQRVLSRVLAIHGDTTTPKSAGSKLIWKCAAELVVGDSPGELNQSLMELGATVCTPTLPSCKSCPISSYCEAYQVYQRLKPTKPTISKFFTKISEIKPVVIETISTITDIEDICNVCPSTIPTKVLPTNDATYIQSLYPFKPPKKAQRQETAIVYVLQNEAQQLYLQKKSKGLLAGLFDFPTQLLDSAEDADEVVCRRVEEFQGSLKGETLHLFTHIKRTSKVISICGDVEQALEKLTFDGEKGRWVDPHKLDDLGVSELCLKNWRMANEPAKPDRKQAGRALKVRKTVIKKMVPKKKETIPEDDSNKSETDLPSVNSDANQNVSRKRRKLATRLSSDEE